MKGDVFLHNIKVNLNGLEIMLFFWNSIISKEKVNEPFINDLCSMKEFSFIYQEEFTPDSLRTILSALNNKEPYKASKKEMKFYSNNLRVMEYIDEVLPAINAIKKMNMDLLSQKLDENINEIIVIPGTSNAITRSGHCLIMDFFAVRLSEGNLIMNGKKIEDALLEV